MATLTGLEPATSAVTGRHANQLRYRAMMCCCVAVFLVLLSFSSIVVVTVTVIFHVTPTGFEPVLPP